MDEGNKGHSIYLGLYKVLETASHELFYSKKSVKVGLNKI